MILKFWESDRLLIRGVQVQKPIVEEQVATIIIGKVLAQLSLIEVSKVFFHD